MKKYKITVDGTVYEVQVEEAATETLHTVSGHSAAAGAAAQAACAAPVSAQGQIDGGHISEQPSGSAATVKAPMPGTILSVEVTAGQQVSAGDVLLVLEAMKMENEILAPAAGRVLTVSAAKGTQVNTGDVLVTLE